MDDLDGVWKVERTGGFLPPLFGVRKEIHGDHGETKLGRLSGVPFDVLGLQLCYRPPFAGFVDIVEPAGDGYRGRATFRGREYGTFRLVRATSPG